MWKVGVDTANYPHVDECRLEEHPNASKTLLGLNP